MDWCRIVTKRKLWIVLVMVSCVVGSVGCARLPICESRVSWSVKELRPLWNVVKRQTSRERLRHWVPQLLQVLLQDGRYRLEERRQQFVIVEMQDQDPYRCRLSARTALQESASSDLLSELYRLVKRHKLSLGRYRYTAPKAYSTSGKRGTQLKSWNCNRQLFRVDLAYWKAISSKHHIEKHKSACSLGNTLRRWLPCFRPAEKKLFHRRMALICRKR